MILCAFTTALQSTENVKKSFGGPAGLTRENSPLHKGNRLQITYLQNIGTSKEHQPKDFLTFQLLVDTQGKDLE